MKIVYVYKALAVWGGVERILVDKMNYLSQHGHQVYAITTDQGDHSIPFRLCESVQHIDLKIRFHTQYAYSFPKRLFKRIELNKRFTSQLKNTINSIDPDIIISAADMYVNKILSLKGKRPLVVESHAVMKQTALPGAGKSNLWKRIRRWNYLRTIRKADVLVTLTSGDAHDWEVIRKDAIVIPNIAHLNETDKLSTCESNHVIFVGRFALQKGIDKLIEIWKVVHEKNKDWHLDIFGEGELKEQYEKVIYSYPDHLNIHIHQPTKDIFDQYLQSSILLLTSVSESFGLVIPEAMSCGLPVVSFDCPFGPREIITDGKDGYLIECYDTNKFAEKLLNLMADESLRREMGKHAVIKAKQYTADAIMPRWEKLFKELSSKQK